MKPPSSLGVSGHRSCTSNTRRAPVWRARRAAGRTS
ncbi:Uncharacterised protein [Bordetella pertussis]|nr:Uncharacterised protein [Bordetella pertussis]